MAFHTAMIFPTSHNQQIGVREASLCVLLVLENIVFKQKINFEHKFNFCVHVVSLVCFFYVFGCVLSVYHLSSHWVRVCLLWVYVVIEHTLNSKCFQISTSWTRKCPQHTLALICCSNDILHFTYHAFHCRPRARNIFLFVRKFECIARLIYFTYHSFGTLNSFLCS